MRGHNNKLGGWVTCNFTSFLTVFQSYQDDGQVIMKGCVQWNPVLHLILNGLPLHTAFHNHCSPSWGQLFKALLA